MTKRRFPWIAQQNWCDILFIHTPVAPEVLNTVVPYPFAIDTYEGQSWISLVLFKATKSRLRYMPECLSYPRFYQMNIRTYVNFRNERGVYFFSINTNNRLVSKGGRFVSLPFTRAPMTIKKKNDSFLFTAAQLSTWPTGKNGAFQVMYRPYAPVFTPESTSLAHFLTERYCIWMMRGNTMIKAPINHAHWRLQQADISIRKNNHLPFPVTNDSFAHYASCQHSVIYPFERVGIVSS